MGLATEMTADLPELAIRQRWMAEPLRAVIFPTSIFLTNRKGFPVLSKVGGLMGEWLWLFMTHRGHWLMWCWH